MEPINPLLLMDLFTVLGLMDQKEAKAVRGVEDLEKARAVRRVMVARTAKEEEPTHGINLPRKEVK